jgi:hypothetical protein
MKEALVKQKERMETAFIAEQAERRARREGRGGALGKHPAEAESSLDAIKRAKIEPEDVLPVALVAPAAPPIIATGREIDISPLPERFVIHAVLRGLEAISADALTRILEVSYLGGKSADSRQTVKLCNRVDQMRTSCYAKRFYLREREKSPKRKRRMKMTKF